MLTSINGTEDSNFQDSAVFFDGRLRARVESDLGSFQAFYPPNDADKLGSRNKEREINKISIPKDNDLHTSFGTGGQIAMGVNVAFGLKLTFSIFGKNYHWDKDLPNVSVLNDIFENTC